MGEFDYRYNESKINCQANEDEDLLLDHVICGEHELLYIDSCLREVFASSTVN